MSHLLSKSKYIRGLQCDRALWLDVHEPRLARYTAEQMRRFDRGRDFEYAFKSRFPDGIDLSAELGRNVDLYPARTAELLDKGDDVVLFEAGFQYDDVLVLADVVQQREDGSLDIYEVKSGTTLSDTYRRDAALQHYVISHCRRVNSFSIVYAGSADGTSAQIIAGGTPAHLNYAGETPAHLNYAGETPAHPNYAGGTPAHPNYAGGTPAHPNYAGGTSALPNYAGGTPAHPNYAGGTSAHPNYAGETPAPPNYAGGTPAHLNYAGETPAYPNYAGETSAHPNYAGETPAHPNYAGETPAHPNYAGGTPAHPGFAIVDLTAELAAEGDRIAANIAEMKTIVRATAEPDTPTGQHCLEPYACPYQHYCAQGVRQMSLFG